MLQHKSGVETSYYYTLSIGIAFNNLDIFIHIVNVKVQLDCSYMKSNLGRRLSKSATPLKANIFSLLSSVCLEAQIL